MKKLQIQIIVLIFFISAFLLINHLLINIPIKASYIIYLMGIIGVVYFLRSLYLHHRKRTYIFYLLGFIFMTLNMIILFIFKSDALDIGIAFSIVSLIFLVLGMVGKYSEN